MKALMQVPEQGGMLSQVLPQQQEDRGGWAAIAFAE